MKRLLQLPILLIALLCILLSCNDAQISPNESVTTANNVDTTITSTDSLVPEKDTGKKFVPKILIKKFRDSSLPAIDIPNLNKEGVVVWELPDKMKTLVETLVEVRIAKNENLKKATVGLDTTKNNFGTQNIPITQKMMVSLISGGDSDFIIVPKDSIHRIPGDNYASWFWSVTPLKSGTRFLILKVAQVQDVNGKETVLEENNVFSKEFKVQVSASYIFGRIWVFIKNNWAIITAIITFFAGFFIRKKIVNNRNADSGS